MTRFLTGKIPNSGILWVSFDPDAICSAPAVTDRRFPAYMAPHESEAAARQALVNAGADPSTIALEQLPRGKRARR